MVTVKPGLILLLAFIMALLWMLGRVWNPQHPAAKACERLLAGVTGLAAWNMIAAPLQLSLGINALSAAVTGWLGLPGIALLTLLHL